MNSEHRLTATRYIWVAFFFTMAIINANVMITGEAPSIANVIMTTILAIAATGTSIAIWHSPNHSSNEDSTSDTKLKRGERVTRLIELMDEDELHELRKRLSKEIDCSSEDYITLGDDGELRHGHQAHFSHLAD